jgi:hypothetical protein
MKISELIKLSEPLVRELGVFKYGNLSKIHEHEDVDCFVFEYFIKQCVESIQLSRHIDEIERLKKSRC